MARLLFQSCHRYRMHDCVTKLFSVMEVLQDNLLPHAQHLSPGCQQLFRLQVVTVGWLTSGHPGMKPASISHSSIATSRLPCHQKG